VDSTGYSTVVQVQHWLVENCGPGRMNVGIGQNRRGDWGRGSVIGGWGTVLTVVGCGSGTT
jgi:hypothetical protein